MSAEGTWTLSMQTPLGDRSATLALQNSGGALSGKLTSDEGASTGIYEGKVEGSNATWKVDIKNPMPLTLEFSAAVDGNRMTGMVSAGAIGSWPFSGSK
jgi:hypothetical protein